MLEAPPAMKDFDLRTFGLSEADLDAEYDTADFVLDGGRHSGTLREIGRRYLAEADDVASTLAPQSRTVTH